MASRSGFIERKSKISLDAFLDILFFETQYEPGTLRKYRQSLELNHNIHVSREAVNRRFNSKLVDFLGNLLAKALRLQYSAYQIDTKWKQVFSGIRIMDSTEFKLPMNMRDQFPGYKGDGTASVAQIQFEYELLSNKITQLKIGNALESDRTEGLRYLDQIPSKTLILRDLGYYSLKAYQAILQRDLYYISKLHSQMVLYKKVDDRYIRITHDHLYEKLSRQTSLDTTIYVGKVEKIPMRLVAYKLKDSQLNRRLKRMQNRQLKRKSKYDHLNLFVTNIPDSSCSSEELVRLYKLRWQIEIVFKSWKSVYRISNVHKMKTDRFQAILLVKMLWIVLNQNLLNLSSKVHQEQISTMKFSSSFRDILPVLRNLLRVKNYNLFSWIKCCIDQSQYCVKEERNHRIKVSEILMLSD